MLNISRRTMSSSLLALLGGCAIGRGGSVASAVSTPPARPPAAIGAFGLDLSSRDLRVRPGNDFFRYMNGAWLATTEIPSDRTRWGAFDMLIEKCDRDVRQLLDDVAHAGGAPGSNRQKIADYYSSFLNTDVINAAGLTPAQLSTVAQKSPLIAFLHVSECCVQECGQAEQSRRESARRCGLSAISRCQRSSSPTGTATTLWV